MSYEHDAPQSDADYECCVRAGLAYEFAVYVSAVGGGTVGRAYDHNHWHYKVIDYRDGSPTYGLPIVVGSSFYAALPTTHRQAAEQIVEFIIE